MPLLRSFRVIENGKSMPEPKLPGCIELALARAHPAWQAHLREGVRAMCAERPAYLSELAESRFLPTEHRLFAAFSESPESVRFVLLGEGPYPRAASATGVCFMDGAVESLWQNGVGLSKAVNRATSLRNFIKMLLVAEGELNSADTSGAAIEPIAGRACKPDSDWVKTAADLQFNLIGHGFLLLNASLVFRTEVTPAEDARAWLPFLRHILQVLATVQKAGSVPVRLILWGKIAEKVQALPETAQFATSISEHPYNLSFIQNQAMQNLFRPLHLLKNRPLRPNR